MPYSNITLHWHEEIPILFQDEHYLVVNKPAGLLVHAYKSESADKTNLLKVLKEQTSLYLYPFHRLDRQVSGPVIFGLSPEATKLIQEAWSLDSTIKEYTLLCYGHTPESGEINFPLSDENKVVKECRTSFETIKHFDSYHSLVKARIFTGRRHQIRRHFAHSRHHLVCDSKYGKARISGQFKSKLGLKRLFLHCSKLEFIHPYTNKTLTFTPELPQELQHILKHMSELA